MSGLEEDLLKVSLNLLNLLLLLKTMIVKNHLNALYIGATQQCDAGKRRRLVHGEEEVLHEGTFGAAAAIYPLEEVP